MKNLNLNHETLDVSSLEYGSSDFLVKVGRTSKAVRIEKNYMGCSIQLFSQKSVKNVDLIAMLHVHSCKDFTGKSCLPVLDRTLIESMPSVKKAIDIIANTSLSNFILK